MVGVVFFFCLLFWVVVIVDAKALEKDTDVEASDTGKCVGSC